MPSCNNTKTDAASSDTDKYRLPSFSNNASLTLGLLVWQHQGISMITNTVFFLAYVKRQKCKQLKIFFHAHTYGGQLINLHSIKHTMISSPACLLCLLLCVGFLPAHRLVAVFLLFSHGYWMYNNNNNNERFVCVFAMSLH